MRIRSGHTVVRAAAALAALALAIEGAAAQAPAPLANAGFEEGAPGALPPGWGGPAAASTPGGNPASAYRALVDADNPSEGRASARLERSGAGGSSPFGALSQAVDAMPYRGRRVRLTAAVRAGAAQTAQVGLWLRVDREGGRLGFFDNMNDRPITGTQWAEYTIEGDVSADAVAIVLGLLVVGDGRAWIDAVRLEDVGPAAPPAAASADPRGYFEQALALLRQLHINSGTADWDGIAGRGRARLATATQLSDAHDAIRDVIATLGERHSFLRPPPSGGAAAAPAGIPPAASPPTALPETRVLDGRFGVVRLPGFLGSPEQAERYTAALRAGLTGIDAAGACGWIVDLRGNTGGNMWPMLNGLDPLLGPGPFGAFRTPTGQLTHWVRGPATIAPQPALADRAPSFALSSADAPVAVLLGPGTASSGEMVAIAFAGRDGARSFGADSAGFSTANVAIPLSDGATLVITTSFARDRTGHEYAGSLVPDERVAESEAEAAAVRWLASQDYCRSPQ